MANNMAHKNIGTALGDEGGGGGQVHHCSNGHKRHYPHPLDGQAFRTKPWNAVATLPALATAVTVVPMHDFGEILQVRRSELAHRWLATTPPPRPCLRPKISNTVLEELKASKQVCLQ